MEALQQLRDDTADPGPGSKTKPGSQQSRRRQVKSRPRAASSQALTRGGVHPGASRRESYVTTTTMERCRSRGLLHTITRSHPSEANLVQIKQRPIPLKRSLVTEPRRGRADSSESPRHEALHLKQALSAPTLVKAGVPLRATTAPVSESKPASPLFLQLRSRPSVEQGDRKAQGERGAQRFGQCPYCMVIFTGSHTTCPANFGVSVAGPTSSNGGW